MFLQFMVPLKVCTYTYRYLIAIQYFLSTCMAKVIYGPIITERHDSIRKKHVVALDQETNHGRYENIVCVITRFLSLLVRQDRSVYSCVLLIDRWIDWCSDNRGIRGTSNWKTYYLLRSAFYLLVYSLLHDRHRSWEADYSNRTINILTTHPINTISL